MRTAIIRTSPQDRALVSSVLDRVRTATHSNVRGALPEALDAPRTPATPHFATTAWQAGEVTGEWVATAGATGDAVALYVHGRWFQHDEPTDVIAARLSAALRMPVLVPRYRLAPAHPCTGIPGLLRGPGTRAHSLTKGRGSRGVHLGVH
jgi:acetyl esterase/lipase